MERRKFTREFKIEAVKLIQERGVGFYPLSTGSCVKSCSPCCC